MRLSISKAGLQAGLDLSECLFFFCHLFLFQTPQQPCEAETACSRDAAPISYCGFCSSGGDVLPSREK